MKKISFNTRAFFLGRNGYFKSIGIVLSPIRSEPKKITIEPITSKNFPGICSIELPVDSIDDFINSLNELKQELTEK